MNNDFSVLVTLHQRKDIQENFIKLIESIYANTLLPKQVLILVDGKINHEFKSIIKYQENLYGFEVFFNPINIGLAKILNLGLEKILSLWVIRVDGDDFCLPNRFEVIMKNIKPNISIIGSYINEIDEYKNIRVKKVPLSDKEIKKYIKIRNPFNHCAVAYRKDHVLKVGGYPDIFLQEDYALWIKMLSNGYKGINLKDVLVNAFFNKDSYKRRSGIIYLKADYCISLLKYRYKIINKIEFLLIIFLRSIFILAPNFIKKSAYSFLRLF